MDVDDDDVDSELESDDYDSDSDSSSSSSDSDSDASPKKNKKNSSNGIRIAGKRKSKKRSKKSSLYQLFEDSKDDSNPFSQYSVPSSQNKKNSMPIVSMKKLTSKNSSIYSTGYQNRTLSSFNAVPIQTEAVLTSISQPTSRYDSDEESLDEIVI
jgi:hypothetical protein